MKRKDINNFYDTPHSDKALQKNSASSKIKMLFDDAIDNLSSTDDIIFGDIIENNVLNSGLENKKFKRTTIFKSLVVELILSFLFGYAGIPAIFRKNMIYGFCKVWLFILAMIATIKFGVWYSMIPVMFLYLLDLGIVISRVVVFIKGNRFSKRLMGEQHIDVESLTNTGI